MRWLRSLRLSVKTEARQSRRVLADDLLAQARDVVAWQLHLSKLILDADQSQLMVVYGVQRTKKAPERQKCVCQ